VNRRSPAGFVCGACAPLFRCAAYDRSCNPGCRFSGRCVAGVTEFVAVFAGSCSVERVPPAAELFALAVASLRVEVFACSDFCPAFFLTEGVVRPAAAELLVEVFADFLLFSFVSMEMGLRALVMLVIAPEDARPPASDISPCRDVRPVCASNEGRMRSCCARVSRRAGPAEFLSQTHESHSRRVAFGAAFRCAGRAYRLRGSGLEAFRCARFFAASSPGSPG